MMKLGVPLGGHLPLGRRDSHSMLHAGGPGSMALSVGGHLPDPQGKAATDTYIRNIVGNKEKEGQTVLALDKSVTPVATHSQLDVSAERGDDDHG